MQVIFAVQDLARSLAFYEQAFDWPRNERIDYANYVELIPPDGGSLGLFERNGSPARSAPNPQTFLLAGSLPRTSTCV
jgi:predicted enzyme related to lactoylglutathione lyase